MYNYARNVVVTVLHNVCESFIECAPCELGAQILVLYSSQCSNVLLLFCHDFEKLFRTQPSRKKNKVGPSYFFRLQGLNFSNCVHDSFALMQQLLVQVTFYQIMPQQIATREIARLISFRAYQKNTRIFY